MTIKVYPGASLSIGDRVYMNAGTSIEAYHELTIGNDVLIGPFVSIIDDDRHQAEPGAVQYKGPTIVGNNVWLGRNVAVLPGVTIGDSAVIGANSVVTKSIPPNSFAAGAPAQVLRKLDIPEGWLRRLHMSAAPRPKPAARPAHRREPGPGAGAGLCAALATITQHVDDYAGPARLPPRAKLDANVRKLR